jgi:hypothetical protein
VGNSTFDIWRDEGGTWMAGRDASGNPTDQLVRPFTDGWAGIERIEKEWGLTATWNAGFEELFVRQYGETLG